MAGGDQFSRAAPATASGLAGAGLAARAAALATPAADATEALEPGWRFFDPNDQDAKFCMMDDELRLTSQETSGNLGPLKSLPGSVGPHQARTGLGSNAASGSLPLCFDTVESINSRHSHAVDELVARELQSQIDEEAALDVAFSAMDEHHARSSHPATRTVTPADAESVAPTAAASTTTNSTGAPASWQGLADFASSTVAAVASAAAPKRQMPPRPPVDFGTAPISTVSSDVPPARGAVSTGGQPRISNNVTDEVLARRLQMEADEEAARLADRFERAPGPNANGHARPSATTRNNDSTGATVADDEAVARLLQEVLVEEMDEELSDDSRTSIRMERAAASRQGGRGRGRGVLPRPSPSTPVRTPVRATPQRSTARHSYPSGPRAVQTGGSAQGLSHDRYSPSGYGGAAGGSMPRPRIVRRQRSSSSSSSDGQVNRVMRRSANEAPVSFATPGAGSAAVARATATVVHTGTDTGANAAEKDCTICCEEFTAGDELRVLPCFHRYHAACIERWLAQSRVCPVCKHDIMGPAPGGRAR